MVLQKQRLCLLLTVSISFAPAAVFWTGRPHASRSLTVSSSAPPTPRIPSALDDDALIAAVCGVCGRFPLPEPCAVPSVVSADISDSLRRARNSSHVRLGVSSLVRLRVLTLARLMDKARQSSVFPADFARTPDGDEAGAFDADPRFAAAPGELPLRFGVLLHPYYLVHGAFDVFVPLPLLCAHVEGDGRGWGGEAQTLGDAGFEEVSQPLIAQRAGEEVQRIVWDLDALTSGGVTLSPDVDLGSLPSVSAELAAATREAASTPRPPSLDEAYELATWRGALVATFITARGGLRAMSPIPWTLPLAALHEAALALHAAVYAGAPPAWTFLDWEAMRKFLKEPFRPSNAPWLVDTLGETLGNLSDWVRFREGLMPPALHASSLPHLLSAFNVVYNDLSEVYSEDDRGALTSELAWGGLRSPGAFSAASALSVSGCVLPGEPLRFPPAFVVQEAFGASVRYCDGFFHFIEGLSMAFPFAEWLRSHPSMSPFVPHDPRYFAWLDLLRLPWRDAPGTHAGKVKAVRARIFHTSDKGLCQDFRQGNVLMGRDVLRHTLALPAGGLMMRHNDSSGGVGGGLGVLLPPSLPRDEVSGSPPEAAAPLSSGTLLSAVRANPVLEAVRAGIARIKAFEPPFLSARDSRICYGLCRSHTPIVAVLRRRESRVLSNHDELVHALLRLPILLHVFDIDASTTVAQTTRALAEADVLIGVHGAGLAHAFLLRPNATVLEISPAVGPGCLCFMRLAALAQLRYINIIPAGSSGYNITVDVGRVIAALSGAI